MSEYVSCTVAARMLGVDARTVRRHCAKGTFEGAYQNFGDGTHWRIPLEGVLDLAPVVSDSSETSDMSEK